MSEALAALGAAAAALQFVEQGLAIAKFLHGTITAMKDAPATLSTRLQHIRQLIAIAQMVIQNPCFQTESIEATLKTSLQQATKLHEMLLKVSPPENAGRRQQWKSAALAFLKQDEVETAFSDLDRQKVLLSLCMQTANAGLVRDIGIHTRVVSSRLGAVSIVVEDTAKDIKSIREILPGLPSQITTIASQLDGISSDFTALTDKLGSMSLAESPPVIQGYFNIPRRRSQHFIGREDTIERIHSALATQPRGRDAKVLVVRGIGGQGKTQLALEVCRRTQNDPFTSILWLDASSEETLQHGFAIIYERTRRQKDAHLTSPEAIVPHVLDCMKRSSLLWLLVLDNLDNPATFASIRDYVPDDGNSSVLITTRHVRVEAYATDNNVIKLEPLSPSEAVGLLLVSAKLQDDETIPRQEADTVVDRLACHPLAIRQAGAFIHRKRLPLSLFVDQLETYLVDILSLDAAMEYIANSSAGDAAITLSVLSTWELSFDHLKEQDNSKQYKADLLTLLAFWPALAVSEAPLRVFCSNIEPWDSPEAMA